MLGNTEVEMDIHGRNIVSPRPNNSLPNNTIGNNTNLNDDANQNTPRLNFDTAAPPNEHTLFNAPDESLRISNQILNTENPDHSNFNMMGVRENSGFNIDGLSTERGNDMFNNGILLNRDTNPCMNSFEKRPIHPANEKVKDLDEKRTITETSEKSQNTICKICLSPEEDPDNDPLISPCNCDGTMRYLHLECLKEWIKSKCKTVKTDNCTTYIWENLFCELCKEKYPDSVIKKRKRIKVLEFSIPGKN